MNKLFVLLMWVSFSSSAHIKEGLYKGLSSDGLKECSMLVGKQTFLNKTKHPLNERIAVEVSKAKFSVYHPPLVDMGKGVASFNHDQFMAVLAMPTGAQALVIHVSHDPSNEGPTHFELLSHDWKAKKSLKLVCEKLKLQ